MNPADFDRWTLLVSEPLMLVTRAGLVRAASPAVATIGFQKTELIGRQMSDFASCKGAPLEDYLRRCARVSTPVPGAVILRTAQGGSREVLCQGMLDQWDEDPSKATILLKFSARENSLRQFPLLNQKIEQLHAEILHRNALENELRKIAADLSETNKRKDEFIAILAHELRNPLAPIRSGLELLKASKDEETLEKVCEIMDRQLRLLVTLVDDLVDVSRITRGKLNLDVGPRSLADVIRLAVESVTPQIDSHNHELIVDVTEREVAVHGDLHRLAQIISNLLHNAAKFTPPGGRIQLNASEHHGEVVVEVIDNGRGIPPDELEHIFEAFTQIDEPQRQGYNGLGIGLTLVKKLVELHGGKVEAESEGPGKGSTFRVKLPVAATARLGQPDTSPAPATQITPGRRVLVVDDHGPAAEMLSHCLRFRGHEVQTAENGQRALEIAASFRPDIVFMDLGMPVMNGLEAARRIRSSSWGRDMKLVALTGWGHLTDREEAAGAGFDHHLVKPVSFQEVLEIVDGQPDS